MVDVYSLLYNYVDYYFNSVACVYSEMENLYKFSYESCVCIMNGNECRLMGNQHNCVGMLFMLYIFG
jgi:hypothetical protein